MKQNKKRIVCAAVATVLLAGLAAFAFLVPPVAADPLYADVPPALFGGQVQLALNARSLAYYRGMAVTHPNGTTHAAVVSVQEESGGTGEAVYTVTLDARYAVGFVYRDITPAVYEQAVAYAQVAGVQLFWPLFDAQLLEDPTAAVNANAPHTEADYLRDEAGDPLLYTPSAHGALRRVRVFYADWYTWQQGRAPVFMLGTDSRGADVMTGVAAALKGALVAALCVAAVAFAAGWAYGALFGRVKRVGWLLDAAACLGAVAFAALCVRYLPSRIGEEGALLCALVGIGWLWAALRCRRIEKKKRHMAPACAVQATPVAVLIGTLLTGCSVLDVPGFGTLLVNGAADGHHALWIPAACLALLLGALVLLGIALQPKQKHNGHRRGGRHCRTK